MWNACFPCSETFSWKMNEYCSYLSDISTITKLITRDSTIILIRLISHIIWQIIFSKTKSILIHLYIYIIQYLHIIRFRIYETFVNYTTIRIHYKTLSIFDIFSHQTTVDTVELFASAGDRASESRHNLHLCNEMANGTRTRTWRGSRSRYSHRNCVFVAKPKPPTG